MTTEPIDWLNKPLPVPQLSTNHHGGNNRTPRKVDAPKPKCANPDCNEVVSAANRKFHSNECRLAAGGTRQRDPANWTTSICAAPWCEIEFEHRIKSHRQYHDDACARRANKIQRPIYMIDDSTAEKIKLDSSYEVLFWTIAKLAKIRIERFDERFPIQWDPDNPRSNFDPDFWLPDYEVAVETKGLPRANMHAQWAAYRATGRPLVVLLKEDIMNLSGANIRTTLETLIAREQPETDSI